MSGAAARRTPYTFSDWKSRVPPPMGWDVADAVEDGWTRAQYDTFLRASVLPEGEVPPPDLYYDPKRSPPPAPAAPPAAAPAPPAGGSGPVPQARTVQQEQPQAATVTQLHTRKTVAADDAWTLRLVCNDEGFPKPSITLNWSLFLANHEDMIGVFMWDSFRYKVMLIRRPPWHPAGEAWEPREIRDSDYAHAVMWLEARRMTPKGSTIPPVIRAVAEANSFDSLVEYLESLQWDGTARLDRWLVDLLGVDGENYATVIGPKALISAVARGLKPGCKVDTMLILEGPQGKRKSTALRKLFGDAFFTDGLSDIGSKDAKMEMQGVWCVEVAEMHRLNVAETGNVKKFLTQQHDRFRPPYGREVIEAPRRCVLAGTINPDGNPYLKDSTGARRFWPVVCTRIDLEAIERDRDQLWAEAVARFRAGEQWWVAEDDLSAVEVEQEKRTDVDVWTEVIAEELRGKWRITQADLLKALGIPNLHADYRHAGRIGRIMKALGWESERDRSNGNDRVIFRNPDRPKVEGLTDQW